MVLFNCLKKIPNVLVGAVSPVPGCAKKYVFSPIQDTVELSSDNWRSLIPNISKCITPKNFLGGGGEANVYIINDKYVLRLFGGQTKIDTKFSPVEDIFEGRNFGQAVAKTKNNTSINRRVFGVPMYKCNDYDPKTYMAKIREYKNLPDETLENFVADVAFIHSKGWRIDETNPENFLYDKATGRIGIIDLCKQNSSSLDLSDPYGHDWILAPLVNSHDVFKIYQKLTPEERREVFDIIKSLQERIIPLCEKYDIPIAKWNKDDYTFTSLINLLDLMNKIDVTKDNNPLGPIIYARYPRLIPNYEAYIAKKAE